MNIGEKLRQLRNEKDYTLKQLEALSGVSFSFISDIENGRRKPGLDSLEKLAKVLGEDLYNFHGTAVVSSVKFSENKEKCSSINEGPSSYGVSDEITELLETLHKRPEMKALFSVSKHASKEDIERAIKIIEALKNE